MRNAIIIVAIIGTVILGATFLVQRASQIEAVAVADMVKNGANPIVARCSLDYVQYLCTNR